MFMTWELIVNAKSCNKGTVFLFVSTILVILSHCTDTVPNATKFSWIHFHPFFTFFLFLLATASTSCLLNSFLLPLSLFSWRISIPTQKRIYIVEEICFMHVYNCNAFCQQEYMKYTARVCACMLTVQFIIQHIGYTELYVDSVGSLATWLLRLALQWQINVGEQAVAIIPGMANFSDAFACIIISTFIEC